MDETTGKLMNQLLRRAAGYIDEGEVTNEADTGQSDRIPKGNGGEGTGGRSVPASKRDMNDFIRRESGKRT